MQSSCAGVYPVRGGTERILTAALLAVLLLAFRTGDPALADPVPDWSGREIRGIHYAVERNSLLPDRWQAELQQTDDCQPPCTVAFDDRMSVVYLRYKWMQLNPQKGVYDFTDLAAQLDVVAAAGKPVSLIVMAGKYTPPWLFEAGAGHLEMRYLIKDEFSQTRVPLVWEDAFVNAHGEMIAALAKFLRETGRHHLIVLAKNGALTTHSGETRLMPPKAFLKERATRNTQKVAHFRAALCADYARAGYSEARIRKAALATTAQIAAVFPDAYLGLAFVTGGQRFPTVDAAGRCAFPQDNATLNEIIRDMVRSHGRRAAINSTFLTAEIGAPPILEWVRKVGGQTGFQVEAMAVGCRKAKNPCDRAEFEATLRTGIADDADFIEVHNGNINRYRDLLVQADRALRGE